MRFQYFNDPQSLVRNCMNVIVLVCCFLEHSYHCKVLHKHHHETNGRAVMFI